MGKRMSNAPVYFTIAQVRYNPILSLEIYAASIQESMRKAGYPDYQPSKSLVINFVSAGNDKDFSPPSPTTATLERHVFLSRDGTRGFIVEQSAISFQTTEYDTFDTFSESFFTGLAIIHKCLVLDYSERIGIRYLDAVVPPGGEEELKDYLAPGVLGLADRLPDDVAIDLSLSETHIVMPDVKLLCRTIIRNGRLDFPMDLAHQGLHVPQRFKQIDGVHAIIDTDASQDEREAFDLVRLRERLDFLHSKIRMAFDASVTEHALKAWE